MDSRSASMGHGMLAQIGAEMAAAGASGAEIAAALEETKTRLDLYVALDTLEYLKRGGRISGARAAMGTMLSIKPIITVTDGIVEQAERVRTRAKARERCLELLTARPMERATVLHTTKRRHRGVPRRVPGSAPAWTRRMVQIRTVGRVRGSAPRPGLRGRGGGVPGADRRPTAGRPAAAATPATRQGRRSDGLVAAG